jgi:WD40 repeat protein
MLTFVALFDIRKGSGPVEYSDIKISHRDPVYGIKWLQSKTHSECISTSTDGQVIIWDTRALNQPLGTYILDLTKGTAADHGKPQEKYKGLILGGESLDYDASYSVSLLFAEIVTFISITNLWWEVSKELL